MEFKVIKRNGNAVIPDGMFKLCGMEDAKLISMVQLNGGILLMPESVSTYQLLMLVDALNKLACDFLEAVAIECGPAEEEHRDTSRCAEKAIRRCCGRMGRSRSRRCFGSKDGGNGWRG